VEKLVSIGPQKRCSIETDLDIQAERWAASKANLKPGAKPSIVRVPAQAAYDCLMSVPVDVEGDVLEIDELKAFLQWQSTLAWLKTGKVLMLLVLPRLKLIWRFALRCERHYRTSGHYEKPRFARISCEEQHYLQERLRSSAKHPQDAGW